VEDRDAAAPPLLLSVGRLREKKGFDVLIEACRILRDLGVSLRCEIVGYGPEKERLEDLIAARRLTDTVFLVGALTRQGVIARYRAATVFVLPCRTAGDGDRDGIPNVLIEAMASGLPVISTTVSGVPEAVSQGMTGLLVPAEDARALSEAIQTLIARPVLRKRLGERARLNVERRFSTGDNLAPLHRSLLAALRGAGHPIGRAGEVRAATSGGPERRVSAHG
jgi:glycosyltransferase involved in cell wall biosynthesis